VLLGRRKPLRIGIALGLVGLAVSAVPSTANAANINVTTTADEFNTGADCGVREAIQASNMSAAFGGCPDPGDPGTPDSIILTSGQTYELTRPDSVTDEGANAIGDLDIGGGESVTITTTGSGRATIDANGDGVGDPVAATGDRAIEVGPNAGGGVGSADSVTLDNLVIADGDPRPYAGGGGGVAYAQATRLDITRSRITANHASIAGGVKSSFGPLTITDSSIDGNTAANVGGVWLEIGSLAITGSTISGNVADGTTGEFDGFTGGLLIGSFPGTSGATLKNTTVSGNSANTNGGGIFTSGAVTLANATVANNTADADAGGAFGGNGGGVFVNTGLGGSVTSRNSILADNTDASTTGTVDHEDCSASSGFTTLGYNIVEVKTGCVFVNATGDQTDVSVSLNPLADNGGPTMTHSYGAGTPPDNAGDPDAPDGNLNCEMTDQRGLPRDISVSRCDIGAFERQPPVLNPIGNRTVTAGQTLAFTATATPSVPGDALTFGAAPLPAGATMSPSGAFSWTPSAAQVGSYPGIQISVSDTSLGDSETITVTVVPFVPAVQVAAENSDCEPLRQKIRRLTKKIKATDDPDRKATLKKKRRNARKQLAALGCPS
jgi:predicted outer membrane repeat protein